VGATNAADITTSHLAESPIRLFLMINTFETGGSERQFTVLAQNADASKFEVHLGCVNPRGPLADQVGKVTQFPLGGSLLGWRAMRSRLLLARYFREHQIEIAHSFDYYTNVTLIPVARMARLPVIIGSHRQLGDLMRPREFRAQSAVFLWCDAVVCNSQAAAARLVEDGLPQEKLVVIGNALPGAAFEPAAPALPRRSGQNGSRVLQVGMVARMNAHYKNHAGFLRIASAIHKRMPDVQFLLAGDGPLRLELEKLAAGLGLGDRVIFLGDRRDVSAVLASMDVAVLTSDSESLSNVILEAMAARLPVVAYGVGGNTELIDDQRGVLVAAGNENEFAAAILRLLGDASLREEMGWNARRFVEENFSLERVIHRYEDLYTTLLKHKGRRKHSA
jgi:glycosyltransferase involved in cell wall biosynthesis